LKVKAVDHQVISPTPFSYPLFIPSINASSQPQTPHSHLKAAVPSPLFILAIITNLIAGLPQVALKQTPGEALGQHVSNAQTSPPTQSESCAQPAKVAQAAFWPQKPVELVPVKQ
jgi:hypothetical protein